MRRLLHITNKNELKHKNKGFTLVELIVVLVILAILAAILVPALLGYIDRAKDQQYILEAKELMTATQAGIAEAYAFEKEIFVKNASKTAVSSFGEPYDFYSCHLVAKAQGNKNSNSASTAAKDIISKRVSEYVDSAKNQTQKYSFYPYTLDAKDVSVIPEGQVGFIIFYNSSGKIIYMEYSRDGKMVTYKDNKFTVTNGGKFIDY